MYMKVSYSKYQEFVFFSINDAIAAQSIDLEQDAIKNVSISFNFFI